MYDVWYSIQYTTSITHPISSSYDNVPYLLLRIHSHHLSSLRDIKNELSFLSHHLSSSYQQNPRAVRPFSNLLVTCSTRSIRPQNPYQADFASIASITWLWVSSPLWKKKSTHYFTVRLLSFAAMTIASCVILPLQCDRHRNLDSGLGYAVWWRCMRHWCSSHSRKETKKEWQVSDSRERYIAT
jgi:hypothetical protein